MRRAPLLAATRAETDQLFDQAVAAMRRAGATIVDGTGTNWLSSDKHGNPATLRLRFDVLA